jgi:lipopolysaccharide/colanic/teichoic acid biosynthesis glycosyltransferase
VTKRAFDLTVVLLLLPVALPLAVVVALAVGLSSGRPVLYRATRMGRGGVPFTMYKFRTMSAGADGPAVTRAGDRRITPVGGRLRRWKLDELPQLYNVLRGDMSLVGPRPEEPRFLARYSDEERLLLSARPGVTGAATVEYGDEEDLLAAEAPADVEALYVDQVMHRKLAIEKAYLARRSFGGDVLILLRTLESLRGRRRCRRELAEPAG